MDTQEIEVLSLKLTNDSDFNKEFESFNDKLDNEIVIDITFDNVNLDKFIELYKLILQTESKLFEDKKVVHFNLNLKDLDKEYRFEALKYALSYEDLINDKLILNVYNLVKTYNSFDDSFFEHPSVLFNNIEEYLDIRTELSDELLQFSKQLIIYYLSVLKSYNITEADTAYLNLKPIPNIYQRILFITDFFTLSKIMNKNFEISTKDLINVQNAGKFLSSLSTRLVISEDFINNLKED